MTPEMAFECLLVTADPTVFSTIEGILQDFSIATKVCPYPAKASPLLKEGSTDLVVIDLEAENSSDFLRQLATANIRQKPTVLGVSEADCLVPIVHVVLRKPVTHEAGVTSVKVAYSRMLRDYRKHTRFAVMSQVLATDDENRMIPLTVTNIGEGGVGLATVQTLRIGSTLRFRLRLPDLSNEILIQARVLWVRPYGAAGCEFVHLPPVDLQLLRAWLENKYRIKPPLILV
jgi:Tfp pilus assembly protein PilZ